MSRAHQQLLKRICHNSVTFERAKEVLHTASIKTTQGSGYELGQGLSGLPAICAYIAAQELGDNDVTEQIAQAASCLKPRLFKTTLNTVKSALSAASASASPSKASSSKPSARSVTYSALLTEKKIGRKGLVAGWMQDAERTLMANRETRRRFAGAYDAITVAVFCWTCQLMGLSKKVDAGTLLADYDIPKSQFEEITEALHEFCQDTAQTIEADIASLKAKTSKSPTKAASFPSKPTATSSAKASSKQSVTLPPALVPPAPPRSPTKATTTALQKSPSKSALRAPSADLSPSKTPSHKRKVAFDGPIDEADEEEFDALATPSKRQKFSSPAKALPVPSAPMGTTPRKSSRLARSTTFDEQEEELPSQPVASSSRHTLDLLQQARRGDSASVPSTPRRTRITSQPSSTHSTHSIRSTGSRAQLMTPSKRRGTLPTVREVENEERMRRKRYRPAFADTQQWLKGDVRLERALRPWTERWRELVGKCGGDVWEAARVAGEERAVLGLAEAAS
ncbi:hypothetical protein BV20DRAFT_1003672 [Pilatotrama ljubarskyi]|nr:hypothetical protein BV20DRAFT_1003672 [Pilatotrama ljubarskyi]